MKRAVLAALSVLSLGNTALANDVLAIHFNETMQIGYTSVSDPASTLVALPFPNALTNTANDAATALILPCDLTFLSGNVRISHTSVDGRLALLLIANAGSWFGETSVFDGHRRYSDALAVGPCELLHLNMNH